MSRLSPLPHELVREILFLVVEPASLDAHSILNPRRKPGWNIIEGATLTSKGIRGLALEAWFNSLSLSIAHQVDIPQLVRECPFPLLGSWVRRVASAPLAGT
jgi:hypothetical protein